MPKTRSYDQSSIQYLEAGEIDRFFGAVRASADVMHVALFEMAYHRGLRASEVGLLRREDLDLSAETISIRRLKGGATGKYELMTREAIALRAWLRIRGDAPGTLFPSRLGVP